MFIMNSSSPPTIPKTLFQFSCFQYRKIQKFPYNSYSIAPLEMAETFILRWINEKHMPLEARVGPLELLFIHGGRTQSVVDFSWNPCEDWTITSVAKTISYISNEHNVNEDVVRDVAWHSRHESLFGSCGHDRNLHIWDIRSPCLTVPVQSLVAHENEMNCLAFNPFNDWIVATGSIDKTIKLFDLRKFTAPRYTLDSHRHGVNQNGWSPHHQEILASCCDGKHIVVWDLNRINRRQTWLLEFEDDPELLFVHDGHTQCVTDLSWNPCEDWTISSVANDNTFQIWKLSHSSIKLLVELMSVPVVAKTYANCINI